MSDPHYEVVKVPTLLHPPKNNRISFGLDADDNVLVTEAAARAGMSVADWCRMAVVSAAGHPCETGDCEGPGWLTIMDVQVPGKKNKLAGNELVVTLQPDQHIASIHLHFFGLLGLRPDEQAVALFAQLCRAVGLQTLSDTKLLHGKRIYIPRLWHNYRLCDIPDHYLSRIEDLFNGEGIPKWHIDSYPLGGPL